MSACFLLWLRTTWPGSMITRGYLHIRFARSKLPLQFLSDLSGVWTILYNPVAGFLRHFKFCASLVSEFLLLLLRFFCWLMATGLFPWYWNYYLTFKEKFLRSMLCVPIERWYGWMIQNYFIIIIIIVFVFVLVINQLTSYGDQF